MIAFLNDCVLESSAVLVLEQHPTGVLRGHDLIRRHFAAFFDMIEKGDGPGLLLDRAVAWL